MSGYSRYEQAVGSVLNRFPRAKRLVEAAYQRILYTMAGQQGFEYDLHEAVTMDSLASFYCLEHEPESTFIGFYDVIPWNHLMDVAFAHEVGLHDSTTSEHVDAEASIVAYSSDGIDPVASTRAWNYQQGSRTQWHPTRSDILLFNDVNDSSLVTRWISVTDNSSRTFPYPIQAVSPTGKEYVSLDYRRLDRNSPGYGYSTDDGSPLSSPSADGLRRVPLDAQKDDELIVSFAELRDSFGAAVSHDNHYIHHAVFSPDGQRLAFLHRWMDGDIRKTRLIISTRMGEWEEHLRHSQLSHFCWLDSTRLFLTHGTQEYGRGYHILDVETGAVEYVDALDGFGDGHPSLSPDGEWIVTDTYPDRIRNRTLILYNLETDETIEVGTFFSPFDFHGSVRCDLHPRWSPDGRYISIDSAHTGTRNTYVIDVGALTD